MVRPRFLFPQPDAWEMKTAAHFRCGWEFKMDASQRQKVLIGFSVTFLLLAYKKGVYFA